MSLSPAPARASESAYGQDISLAHTSEDLSFADVAWHLRNTYGYPVTMVVAAREVGDRYVVETDAGRFDVWPRDGQHPKMRPAGADA